MKGKPTLETIAKQLSQLYEGYYQSEIFNIKAELELMVYSEILKVDPSAMPLDMKDMDIRHNLDILDRELPALNIELFGLAWLYYNQELFEEGKQDSGQTNVAVCTEIMFAKSYLENTKQSDTWNAAGFYNRTILEAAIAQSHSIDWSTFRDMPAYYERAAFPFSSVPEEAIRLSAQSFLEYFGKLLKDEVNDKECAIRLSNRLATVNSWRVGIMIPQKLSSAFAERLGFIPNSETIFLFHRLVVGLYKNARNYINDVSDYGSWELARKAAIDRRQSLLEAGRELLEKQNRSDEPKQSHNKMHLKALLIPLKIKSARALSGM